MTRWMIPAAVLMVLAGCSTDGAPTLLENPNPGLQKNSAQLAADAAKRNYEADAPKSGTTDARAEFDLNIRRMDLTNISNQDWQNVEVWVNQKYVVFIPKVPKQTDERLDFEMFYDRDGNHFDTEGGKNPIKSVEICRDGTMYTIKTSME